MKFYFLLLFCILCLTKANCQIVPDIFLAFESRAKADFDSIKNITDDSARLQKMDEFEGKLADILKDPASFEYPFDSLKLIGRIQSPDNQFRMFNWNMRANSESFKNYCIIQLKPEKEQACKTIILHDNTDIDQTGNQSLTSKNWYGALYYKIIPVKISGTAYYTLLGLDSHSPFVSKKIIDVLFFNNEEAFIGAPVFNVKGKMVSRFIFSFSARITMMLNYDEALNTIVFDHLSPSESRYTGQFEYYGPDFSFDGFIFDKKQWLFIEDIKPNRPVKKSKKQPGSSKMRQ